MNAYEEEFYDRGYIVVRNILPNSVVREWSQIFAHPSFIQSIFHIMHENHHISHPLSVKTSSSFISTLTGTSAPTAHVASDKTSPDRPTTITPRNASRKVNDVAVSQNISVSTISLPECHNHTNQLKDNTVVLPIQQQYTMSRGVKHGYREIVMRSPGRYEIALLSLFDATNDKINKIQLKQQFTNISEPELLISSIIRTIQSTLTFVPNLLNQQPPPSSRIYVQDNMNSSTNTCNTDPSTRRATNMHNQDEQLPQHLYYRYTWSDVKIINVSIIVSTPGSADQKWHADGGHVDIEKHLPCHCCNIFVPLTAITELNGPTEFRPRSHYYTRQLTKMMLLAKARNELQPIDAPTVSSLGDIIVFDYRILHRGRGNNHLNDKQEQPAVSDVTNEPSSSTTRVNGTTGADRTDNHDESSSRSHERMDHGHHSNHRVILVITVSLPWFHDVLNYPKSSSIFDARNAGMDTTINT